MTEQKEIDLFSLPCLNVFSVIAFNSNSKSLIMSQQLSYLSSIFES